VGELHAADAPTAALAVVLAPSLVLTDNRKHFLPLVSSARSTDESAVDAFSFSKLSSGANAAALIPTLAGAAVIEGRRSSFRRSAVTERQSSG